MDDVDGLASVLSDEGWAYASAPSVEPGDPGRFHALFGRDSLITALQVLPARPDVARATLRATWRRPGRSGTSSATLRRSRSSKRGGAILALSRSTGPPTRRRGSS